MSRQYRSHAVLLIVILGTFSYSPARSADAIQTQMSMSGDLDIDVVKASILDKVLTVVLAYRNNGDIKVNIKYPVDEVYFIDDIEKKKYHVLKDSKNEWIAAPKWRGSHTDYTSFKITSGGKQLVWFKFPAPPAAAKTINLVIPDALPFEGLAISR